MTIAEIFLPVHLKMMNENQKTSQGFVVCNTRLSNMLISSWIHSEHVYTTEKLVLIMLSFQGKEYHLEMIVL